MHGMCMLAMYGTHVPAHVCTINMNNLCQIQSTTVKATHVVFLHKLPM